MKKYGRELMLYLIITGGQFRNTDNLEKGSWIDDLRKNRSGVSWRPQPGQVQRQVLAPHQVTKSPHPSLRELVTNLDQVQ